MTSGRNVNGILQTTDIDGLQSTIRRLRERAAGNPEDPDSKCFAAIADELERLLLGEPGCAQTYADARELKIG